MAWISSSHKLTKRSQATWMTSLETVKRNEIQVKRMLSLSSSKLSGDVGVIGDATSGTKVGFIFHADQVVSKIVSMINSSFGVK